ncbi:MAG: EamA family transporter RarD [Spirochaetaceae bacterium]|jgi:chloramphenicol-sensitive protein RarD|nr:EamA family transporter RarD [Spirochaetaceae bacterium]
MVTANQVKGVSFTVISQVAWGILPVYWKLLAQVNSLSILAFRILCSFLLILGIFLPQRNTRWLRILAEPGRRLIIAAAAGLVTCNWGLYIWAINAGHTVESSLGYYINPLVSIVLGLIFFQERLSRIQWTAFGFAAAGVALLTFFSGAFPWISLGLALSFGFYGLCKKKAAAGSLETLGAETLLAAPLALLLILLRPGALDELGALSPGLWVLLIFSGAVTALPLYCFARGAKLLPLSALGFIQFVNPTILLITGVFIFKEPFPVRNLLAFALIWAAVFLYSISFLRRKP